jgi:peroxidase
LIDEIKAAVENACPGVVSCADILALATMDATSLAGGPQWAVPTGRRDSTVSLAATANSLPSETMTVAQASQSFASIGLSPQDLVILLGAHTVGATHCNFMADRLYNFQNTGAPDPTMDPGLVQGLKNVCVPPGVNGPDTGIFLDQGTGTIFDNVYFQQLLLNRGVMQIDQELSNDPTTSPFVQSYSGAGSFFADFATSMVKLGNNNVLTGSQGEIRLTCSAING